MSFNNFKLVRLIEKDKRREAYERNQIYILKFCRFLIHIVLFLVVLASAIVSKGSLLLITNETNHFEKVTHSFPFSWTLSFFFTQFFFFSIRSKCKTNGFGPWSSQFAHLMSFRSCSVCLRFVFVKHRIPHCLASYW